MAPTNNAIGDTTQNTMNSVGQLRADGHSKIHVGNNYSIDVYNYANPNHNRCLADLRLTDPRDDKTRIEQTKGGLLRNSYKCILDHADFQRWRDDQQHRFLWIKGDAGKVATSTTSSSTRTRLSLDLNSQQITQAVNIYIEYKVSHLVSLKDNKPLRDQVQDRMRRKADGTILWAALVLQELQNVQIWNAPSVLDQILLGLVPMYDRMMAHIEQLSPEDGEFCRRVLLVATIAYRPLHLCELVHQSAKDYLTAGGSSVIFKTGVKAMHHTVFSKSLQIMSETLRHNIYGLCHPGIPIDDVKPPDLDPLAPARYPCIYWVDHLYDACSNMTEIRGVDLQEGGMMHGFLSNKYLYWLEALGLLRGMSEGVLAMSKLDTMLGRVDGSRLVDFVRDARRFIMSYGWVIQNAPLQAYSSALVFSPAGSIIRRLFRAEEPDWIEAKPGMEDNWNACLMTLEGHMQTAMSITFSHDSNLVASASQDKMVKIWDVAIGHCLTTLEGHQSWVSSVVFSHDSKLVASASQDKTVGIWDAATGHCLATLAVGRSFENINFDIISSLHEICSFDLPQAQVQE
ncbi:hypothetical protein AK830_g3718 [Neonectria ditissima]|uniref:Uncharacterized protein n=1 Tax=Neonectria ditissima TaxID=78410 RepID=A0A0P7BAY6_9HYPO|nr:hypothetical protein AK830_g3718 [Neonectria ditissima]